MRLKLSTRLILNSLLLSVIPLVIVGFYSLSITEAEIEQDVQNEIALVRETRQNALNSYLELTQKQISTLAEDERIITALRDFNGAFNNVETDLGKRYDTDLIANESLLKARYVYQEANTPDAPKDALIRWWPKDRITRILQHYYIANNPYPIEKWAKENLDFSGDGSRYSQVHKRIHPILRDFRRKFEYHNIFLVDATTGYIVYTVDKSVEFATNLNNGPYSDSSMARVVKAAIDSNTPNSIHVVDIEPYTPYFNRHVAFVAAPIFDAGIKIGVLIFQLKRHRLEHIMTNTYKWKESGMGQTGEALLVGNDYLLRNESRYMIEDSTAFIRHLKETKISESIQQAIEKDKTTVNHIEFHSPAVDDALKGNSGILHTNNYLGNHSIIAYAPVVFAGIHWALIATVEESEAFAGLNHLRIIIFSLLIVLAGLAALIGWWSANSISHPIIAMINTLSSSSSQMASTTSEHERIANQQAASVNETNTTMEELGISSKQSAQQAQAASEVVQTVLTLAENGGHQVQEMLQGMEGLRDKVDAIAQQILRLSEQTSQISSITNLMTDFANETKMLAMNAAVEAVRAGEQGRGFSVLSVEIRKLAEESRHSAERINTLVEDVQKATNATVMATEEGTKTVEKTIGLAHTTASTFTSVAESMHNISINAQQISLNIKQQAEAVRQVVIAMNELKTGAKEGSAGISQTKDGIKTLNEVALKLKAMT